MPYLLLSMLERRYLGDLQPSRWALEAPGDDGARPLLREISALPRSAPGEDSGLAMPHILSASHSLGQAVVTAIFGDGTRHRFFVGGRRVARGDISSTEDFLDGQASVLRAHLPGLELGQMARLDRGGHEDLATFLADAPAVAVLTGIPSRRSGGGADAFQNLDRLTDAASGHKYAVLIVAEPLDPADMDTAVDSCRRLKSEVHALVHRTETEALAEGRSESKTSRDPDGEPDSLVPNVLTGLGVFCMAAGLISALHPTAAAAAKAISPLMSMANQAMMAGNNAWSRAAGQQDTLTSGTSQTLTRSGTTQLLNANAEACKALLTAHIERLDSARSGGWWRTAVYVVAETDGALAAVTAALRAICSGGTTGLDPMRAIRVAPWAVRPAVTRGQTLTLRPTARRVGHPLGPAFDALATCMTSDELSVLLSLPRREVAGLRIRDVGKFALSAPPPGPQSVSIGHLVDAHGQELDQVCLSAAEINRHVLITGMTGYGKTTTAKQLLLRARAELGTPFLVIEPAKAEYRQLRFDPALLGSLRVYSISGHGPALPLRVNPFVPVEGAPLGRHIDLLKSVFNAAFPMFAGMPAVLEEAMLDIYAERGWNLRTGQNDALGARPSPSDVSAVAPTMRDLHDQIEVVLARKGYAGEVHQNMGAALRSRINSLMVGVKGDALAAKRSIPPSELFAAPCVIELKDLADDEEKSFVMGLLLSMLYEYAESRQPDPELTGHGLQHITLIEEAHRLLRAPRGGGMETGDAQAKAVTMFTDLLAEMRAYGEAFIVADQIPVKLAPEVLKNSNIKIIHRLSAPDDRAAVAASINLSEEQSRHLVALQPGMAVVHDDVIGSAVLTRISGPSADSSAVPQGGREPDRWYLQLNGGCARCPMPCTFTDATRRLSTEDALDAALEPFFQALLLADADGARDAFATWHRQWQDMSADAPAAEQVGTTYCAVTQSAYRWLGRTIAARVAAERAITALREAAVSRVAVSGTALPGAERPAGADLAGRLLAQDRGARHIARLIAAWLSASPPAGATAAASAAPGMAVAGDEQLEMAIARLHELLTAAPPREMVGCTSCPARCRMLPMAVEFLAGPGKGAIHRVNAATSAATRGRAVEDLLAQDPALGQLTSGQRRDLLHCVITNAGHAGGTEVAEILATLSQHDRGSLHDHAPGASDAISGEHGGID
jgi:DNA helicase HerA-like ATPase